MGSRLCRSLTARSTGHVPEPSTIQTVTSPSAMRITSTSRSDSAADTKITEGRFVNRTYQTYLGGSFRRISFPFWIPWIAAILAHEPPLLDRRSARIPHRTPVCQVVRRSPGALEMASSPEC